MLTAEWMNYWLDIHEGTYRLPSGWQYHRVNIKNGRVVGESWAKGELSRIHRFRLRSAREHLMRRSGRPRATASR